MNWFLFTHILANLITTSIHAWLTKDYRSSGMCFVLDICSLRLRFPCHYVFLSCDSRQLLLGCLVIVAKVIKGHKNCYISWRLLHFLLPPRYRISVIFRCERDITWSSCVHVVCLLQFTACLCHTLLATSCSMLSIFVGHYTFMKH